MTKSKIQDTSKNPHIKHVKNMKMLINWGFSHVRDSIVVVKGKLLPIIPLLFCIQVCISCGRSPEEIPPENVESQVEKTYRRGPLFVRIHLDKNSLSIAETLTLTIYAEIEDAYDLELPLLADGTGGFGILDYSTEPKILLDDGLVANERSFVLEPFLSGEYSIPPLMFTFTEKGTPADASEKTEHTLSTEEIAVQVTSILPEDFEELELRDITGPVLMPRGGNRSLIIALSVSLAALLGTAVAIFIIKSRRKPPGVITVPPHELAFRSLEELLEANLLDNGEIKLFYERISAILREYIENRYGIHAPERTTEEFLQEIQRFSQFSNEQRRILEMFLNHCDLVKFAEHNPTQEDIQNTFDTCKEFVLAEVSDAVS